MGADPSCGVHPAQLPQGRKAARVSGLWRVCEGSSFLWKDADVTGAVHRPLPEVHAVVELHRRLPGQRVLRPVVGAGGERPGGELGAVKDLALFQDLSRRQVQDVDALGAAFTPPPYAPDLEAAWLPDRDDIAAALRRLAAF